MRIRHSSHSGNEKVELQMTPMIDVVFQLLIFFLLTFKIVPQEGDFNVKMPLGASQGVAETPLETIVVRLTAAPDGKLAGIQMGQRAIPSFDALHNEIMALVGTDTGPSSVAESTEVELDCDYNLDYRYVIGAITAISGYVDRTGNIVKVVDKIKFAPPRAP
jgi:biopolymer transport protein ExbD